MLKDPYPLFVEYRYDAFGRVVRQTAEDRSHSTARYHALSTEYWDPLDSSTGPFFGTFAVGSVDGHGRAVAQRLHQKHVDGREEFHFLFSYYRADGATTRLLRALAPRDTARPTDGSSFGLNRWVERRFIYDTAKRRVASIDPDTDNRIAGPGVANRTWRYLYNMAGDLAAVRDPRGCGQNFLYDRAGRLIGEQYVSCSEAQLSVEGPVATAPAGSIAVGIVPAETPVQSLYHFDREPAWAKSVLPNDRSGVLGRATGVTDRGQRSAFAYDDRGNTVFGMRQLALIAHPAVLTLSGDQSGALPSVSESAEQANGAAFDVVHTYTSEAAFDHGGRSTSTMLPADPDFVGGPAPRVGGTLAYANSGLVKGSTIVLRQGATVTAYPVVVGARYTRDGLISRVTYGDGLQSGRPATYSETLYDARRRPINLRTFRASRVNAPAQSLSAVGTVVDQQLVWDAASNLTDIFDQRPPGEWPDGHKPQTVHAVHDALYRVVGAYYEYGNPLGDAATNWRDTETDHRAADPLHAESAPMLASNVPSRIEALEYDYDWLANMTAWEDDGPVFFERSLGSIVNGNDLGASDSSSPYRPSALYFASNLGSRAPPTSVPLNQLGYVEVDYGTSGNVVALTVHAQCTNAGANVCSDHAEITDLNARRLAVRGACACARERHYQYRYDELNRVSEARRFDRNSTAWALKARQRYRYDSSNARTVRHSLEPTGAGRATLFVSDQVERRGLTVEDGQYRVVQGETETQYLVAGARVVWRTDAAQFVGIDGDHRITFALSDVVRSTSAVIDLLSGELLEVTGFYPHGAREHWLDSSEPGALDVPLEPVGFTGKEADEDVGLAYFGERYLISRLGRWATPDPAEIHALAGGDSLNAYHYVSGNLIQARDPLGLREADGEAVEGDGTAKNSEVGTLTADTNADGKDDVTFYDFGGGQPSVPDDVPAAMELWRSSQRKGAGARGSAATGTTPSQSASAAAVPAAAPAAGNGGTAPLTGAPGGAGKSTRPSSGVGSAGAGRGVNVPLSDGSGERGGIFGGLCESGCISSALAALAAAGASAANEIKDAWDTITGIGEILKEASEKGAVVLGGLLRGKADEASGAIDDDFVDVYRGVGANHPALPEARAGNAYPQGGHRDPVMHNHGDTESDFTSWTTDPTVAEGWADRHGPGGVVLQDRVRRSELVESPDIHDEFEVLREGPIEGANVIVR